MSHEEIIPSSIEHNHTLINQYPIKHILNVYLEILIYIYINPDIVVLLFHTIKFHCPINHDDHMNIFLFSFLN